jgi:ribose transport system permease protein
MGFARNKFLLLGLRNIPLILFILIFIIFGMLSPRFLQYRSFENILKQASYIGIVAVGMTIILLTGGIDLSVGANMFLSTVVLGLLINRGIPVWLAFLACLLTGLIFGAVNAFFIVKLRILPFIVTLSTLTAGRGVALLITKSQAILFPSGVLAIGSYRVFDIIPLPIVIFIVVVAIAYLFLKKTTMGRQIYAVGHDMETAKKAGINTYKVLATVYLISGLLAALGGFVSIAQIGLVNAGFGEEYEFNAIAAAVLGGTSLFGGIGGVFPGTVIGTVLIQMVQSGLVFIQMDLYIQPLVTAAIIFLAIFIDTIKTSQLKKLEKRNIRIEELEDVLT